MLDLLLLLCRYPYHPESRDRLVTLLSEVTDWTKTVALINAHGIIALAAYNIKEAGLLNEIPEKAMAVLEDGYRQSMVRNLWLTERWKEVNSILGNAGVKHVLLKGMALEHTVYGSKGLRQMTDNDILVKREDAMKAWNLLKQNGYSNGFIKSPLHRGILMDIGKHLPSLYKDGYTVEIHHKLSDNADFNKKISFVDPVDSAVEISVSNLKAWILEETVQLMHLKDHLERHAMEGTWQLRLYNDIILLDKTAKIEIPESFILEPDQEKKPQFRKAAYRNSIASVPGNLRFRYLAGDIFPSVEWMKSRYGCSGVKAMLYYPARIGKLRWLI